MPGTSAGKKSYFQIALQQIKDFGFLLFVALFVFFYFTLCTLLLVTYFSGPIASWPCMAEAASCWRLIA